MTLTGAEGAVRAVIAGLQAAMPAKLLQIEAGNVDAIELPPPVAYHMGRKSLAAVPQFPVVIVLAERGNDAWQGGTDDGTENISTNDLVIGMLVLDQDTEVLQVRLYRYLQALLEVIIEGTASDLFDGWVVGAADDSPSREYSDVFAQGDSRFIADVRLRVTAVKPEVSGP